VTVRIEPDGANVRHRAAELLRAGGVVAIPTDTVYGIAADLSLPDSIERLFAVKRRPPDKAVALLLSDPAQAGVLGVTNEAAKVLGERFWPGGLTLVLPARPDAALPAVLAAGRPTVGVRVPDHPCPRQIAAVLGPLPTTSANLSGEAEARDAHQVAALLGDGLALVIDGGPIRGGPASSVVDCTGDRPRLLRAGAIPAPELAGVLDEAGIEHDLTPAAAGRTGTRAKIGAVLTPSGGAAVSVSQGTRLGWATIAEVDPELWSAMESERRRQHDKIELIASENYVFGAVMEAQGSWLTNKYAEGLPGRRYYGGCEFVDVAERLAQERALALFPGAEHVNVQPHSGAQANMAAYFSVLEPGDRILGMRLDQGGHLTHGMKLNFSGRFYEVHAYGVDQSHEHIDYDAMERQARDVRPRIIVAGASAYPRVWDFKRMAAIAHDVGALLFVDMAHIAGLVAAGVHPSPFPHADIVTTTTHKTLRGPRGGLIFSRRELPEALASGFPRVKDGALAAAIDKTVFPGVQGGPLMHVIAAKAVAFRLALEEPFRDDQRRTVDNARLLAETIGEQGARLVSGGTDNHLMLVDVTPLGVTGKQAEELLDEVGITVNKNQIPFDQNPPNTSSGIRVGTPAVTTRGMGPDEMRTIGRLIVSAIASRDDEAALARAADEVRAITARFPVPGLERPA